jgi:hypothetical protein
MLKRLDNLKRARTCGRKERAMGKNGGGPAFPLSNTDPDDYIPFPGMTLRDYFAGQALAGLASKTYSTATNKALAKRSYALADAMLAERERKTNATD